MNLGPLKTSVSRKTICFSDNSSVKFIVVLKEFVKSLKLFDFGFRKSPHWEYALISYRGMVCKGLHVVVVYRSHENDREGMSRHFGAHCKCRVSVRSVCR